MSHGPDPLIATKLDDFPEINNLHVKEALQNY